MFSKKEPPKRRRKSDQTLTDCLDQLYAYLEDDDECQYTLTELHSLLNNFSDEGEVCSRKWLKEKLIEHCGDDIIIADSHGMTDIVSFRDFGYKILRNRWAHSNDLRTNEDNS